MSTVDFDVLADVAYELFGDAVDPREIVAKMNDAAEVHVPGNLTPSKNKKKGTKGKVINTIGQGLNALAIGAGTHALVMAGRDERLQEAAAKDKAAGKMSFSRVASKPYRAWAGTKAGKAVGPNSNWGRKYAVPLAGGALALHGAEIVGDSIAAHALHNQRKQSDVHIKKVLSDIVDARRRGVITTDTAIAMADELVTKAIIPAEREAKKIVPMTAREIVKPAAKPKLGVKPTKMAKPDQNKQLFNPESIGKSDAPEITWTGTISKRDDEKRQVFGYATVTHINGEEVVDLQGDYVPLDEIEKAAYTYVIESRKGGDMHRRDGDAPLHTSDLVESFVVTPEKLEKMGLDPNAIPHGWWVGFKVNDDSQWEMVKKNERTGFSIHGSGRRVEREI